jgi:hypothetical protein
MYESPHLLRIFFLIHVSRMKTHFSVMYVTACEEQDLNEHSK